MNAAQQEMIDRIRSDNAALFPAGRLPYAAVRDFLAVDSTVRYGSGPHSRYGYRYTRASTLLARVKDANDAGELVPPLPTVLVEAIVDVTSMAPELDSDQALKQLEAARVVLDAVFENGYARSAR